MATALPASIPVQANETILNALVTAAFILHSGKAVLDFTQALFDEVSVEEAIAERKMDEKAVGINGGFGEGQSCKALVRAHVIPGEHGKERNAEGLKKVTLGHFTRDVWEENLRVVQQGL